MLEATVFCISGED